MSRTKKTNEVGSNPAGMSLRWDSDQCNWQYWDKAAEEQKHIPANTPFIVLDQLTTVTGYDERAKSGLWSNEVRSVKDTLRIQSKKGVLATGPWADIKGTPGAKFATSVYAMANIDGTYRLVNFKMSGCALGPWIDFVKEVGGRVALEADVVVFVKEVVEGKKGRVTFNSPVFAVKTRKLSDEAAHQADQYDMLLQEYLEAYLGQKPEEASDAPKSEPEPEPPQEEEPEEEEPDGDDPDCPF